MKKHLIKSNALRMTFVFMSAIIWLGIWLTGFGVVHWVLFIPAFFLAFAGVTGICPGLIVNKMLLHEK